MFFASHKKLKVPKVEDFFLTLGTFLAYRQAGVHLRNFKLGCSSVFDSL
jgi:hypothetical protein